MTTALHVYAYGAVAVFAYTTGTFLRLARGRLIFPPVPWWRVVLVIVAFALAWPLTIPALLLEEYRDG